MRQQQNFSSSTQHESSAYLSPIYSRNQKTTMRIDMQSATADYSMANSTPSNASTSASLSPDKRSSAATNYRTSSTIADIEMISAATSSSPSPAPQSFINPKTKPIDMLLHNSAASNNGGSIEMIEPLNLVSMESLGEPDPTAITKQDLLSAMAFDRTGKILSVGDRGGRVICFQNQRNE